jgi:hypothetical protein
MWSLLAVASWRPSGENATPLTPLVWPGELVAVGVRIVRFANHFRSGRAV